MRRCADITLKQEKSGEKCPELYFLLPVSCLCLPLELWREVSGSVSLGTEEERKSKKQNRDKIENIIEKKPTQQFSKICL